VAIERREREGVAERAAAREIEIRGPEPVEDLGRILSLVELAGDERHQRLGLDESSGHAARPSATTDHSRRWRSGTARPRLAPPPAPRR